MCHIVVATVSVYHIRRWSLFCDWYTGKVNGCYLRCFRYLTSSRSTETMWNLNSFTVFYFLNPCSLLWNLISVSLITVTIHTVVWNQWTSIRSNSISSTASLCNTCITSHFKPCHFVYIPYITHLICKYCTRYHLLHLAYAVLYHHSFIYLYVHIRYPFTLVCIR